MKNKTAYAVFTKTSSDLDYMVKGNFGDNEELANRWAYEHREELTKEYSPTKHVMTGRGDYTEVIKYPNGLFVKEVTY